MTDLQKLAKKFDQVSEKYCADNNILKTDDWVILKFQEEVGELCQAWLMKTHRARDKGHTQLQLNEMLAEEAADAFGMLMIFIKTQNIDINKYIEKKWHFNPED